MMIANTPIGKVWVVKATSAVAELTGYTYEIVGFAEGQEGDLFQGFDQTALVCIDGVMPNSTSCPISSGSVDLQSRSTVLVSMKSGNKTLDAAEALLKNHDAATGYWL